MAIGHAVQPAVVRRAHAQHLLAAGEVLCAPERGAAGGAVAREDLRTIGPSLLECELDVRRLGVGGILFEGYGGGQGRGTPRDRRGDRRCGELQRQARPAHLDLQYRHQAHVAPRARLVVWPANVGVIARREGGVLDPLDLALRVTRRPVQHVESIGQVLRILRSQLQVQERRPARLQPLHSEAEGLLPGEGRHISTGAADPAQAGHLVG